MARAARETRSDKKVLREPAIVPTTTTSSRPA